MVVYNIERKDNVLTSLPRSLPIEAVEQVLVAVRIVVRTAHRLVVGIQDALHGARFHRHGQRKKACAHKTNDINQFGIEGVLSFRRKQTAICNEALQPGINCAQFLHIITTHVAANPLTCVCVEQIMTSTRKHTWSCAHNQSLSHCISLAARRTHYRE